MNDDLSKIETYEGRLYVVGDLHGTLSETASLLDHLQKKQTLNQTDQVVFVGDYIDRGYESCSLVNYLIDFAKDFPNTKFLKGNHEDMFLDFMGLGGTFGSNFIRNGGAQTLISYGFDQKDDINEIFAKFPPNHIEFFQSLKRIVCYDKFIVAHAGLNPLRDLTSQRDEDLFWIRDEFIMSKHSFDKTIVFGHTPFKTIFNDYPSKLGIDTGLVYGNMLSCVELTQNLVFQVKSGKKRVEVLELQTAP